jgi:hypothetical protein
MAGGDPVLRVRRLRPVCRHLIAGRSHRLSDDGPACVLRTATFLPPIKGPGAVDSVAAGA